MKAILDTLAAGTTRHFQPDPAGRGRRAADEPPQQKRLAALVGAVALGLPPVLAIGVAIDGGCFRDSISHFYYDRYLGAVFVGMMFFIAGFLIAYTGDHWLENVGSTVAGLGAAFVAVFPTSGPGCERTDPFLTRIFATYQDADGDPASLGQVSGSDFFALVPGATHVHAFAAAIVFGYLALYCLVVLRRVVPSRHGSQDRMIATKRRRNILYAVCGLTILACIAALGLKEVLADTARWNAANLTFAVETLALWAFGVAWLAKGRVFPALNDA